MSRDRLADRTSRIQPRARSQSRISPSRGGQQQQQRPNDFNGLSMDIKDGIASINSNTETLQSLHRRALADSTNSQSTSAQIEDIIDLTSTLIAQTRTKVKNLANAPGGDKNMKSTQQKSFARKLMEAAKAYQRVQQDAKDRYRDRLERQYKIAKPNASRREVEDAVNGDSRNVFQQQAFGSQRKALEDVQSRQNELHKIEESLMELFSLMQDMQMLIENQQTIVDTIETNIDTAVFEIESGSQELTKATGHARSARKKKLILLCCMLVLLIIAIIAIVFVLRNLGIINFGGPAAPAPAVATPAAIPLK